MEGTLRACTPGLPGVIILSGWATGRQVELARALGVTDVLQKPVPLRNLTEALTRSQQP